MSFEIHRNDGITDLVNGISDVINRQFKKHDIALECVIVPTNVEEPEKPTEPKWRSPITGIDEGNPTAEFRDSDTVNWMDWHGSWRGEISIDDGTAQHVSGSLGVIFNFARVKDHGPHVAPKSSN